MEFGKFVEWAFYGTIGSSCVYAVAILSDLRSSVEKLNERVAVIIEKTAWHEKQLEKHDARINNLEGSKPKRGLK